MLSIVSPYTFISSCLSLSADIFFFFFNDTATTEIYTLSLHDALPISERHHPGEGAEADRWWQDDRPVRAALRSEEHTSELQSRQYLVCRLLLEKKKKKEYRRLHCSTKGHGEVM